MPALTDGTVIAINAIAQEFNQTVMLTTTWRLDNISLPGSTVDMAALFNAISTEMDAFGGLFSVYASCLNNNVTDIQWRMQPIYPTRYVATIKTPAQVDGLVDGDPLPQNCAAAITLRTDLAGRDQIGTKHIGGLSVTFWENGYISAAGALLYESLADLLSTSFNVTVGTETFRIVPILFSRTSPINTRTITSHALGTTIRVERRRTVGLGS